MKELARLSRYVLRYKTALLVALAAAVLSSVFLGGAVSLLKPLIAEMMEGPGSAAAAPAPGRAPAAALRLPGWIEGWKRQVRDFSAPLREWLLEEGYIRVPLAIVFLYLMKGVFGFVSAYGFQKIGLRTVADLRQELYARAVSQSDAFYLVHGTAEMQSRILGDIARLQRVVSAEVGQAAQALPMIVVLLGLSLFHAWQVTAVCLFTIPLFGYATNYLGRRVKKASRRSQERQARLTALIEETLLARRVVQAFHGVEYEIRRFGQALKNMLVQDLRVARANSATPPAMELLGALIGAGIIVYAGSLLKHGTVGGQDLLVSVVALLFVFVHVRRLGQLNNSLQQAIASAHRVFEVLDEPVLVQDAPSAGPLAPFRRDIVMEKVSFSYGRGPVLQGVTLEIKAGEVHALVGPSGAGKSTLAMLLPRFADPSSGRVLIDGVDAREVTVFSLRAQIALVSQETHLFDDTVAANIAYARPDASSEDIRQAARAAHAEEFILQLPQGYQTRLGERGNRLSVGQRQRLAIARAFLKDAPILILDEATSQLDPASERVVQEALEDLLAGRTALIIAHRLHTVTGAHRIHVLCEGRIAESGTHAELIARRGQYARLYALQAETPSSPPRARVAGDA